MRHINPEFGDKILRKNDVTPNTLGTELAGVSPTNGGLDFNGIIQGINEGRIKAIYLIEDDIIASNPEFENVFAKLKSYNRICCRKDKDGRTEQWSDGGRLNSV